MTLKRIKIEVMRQIAMTNAKPRFGAAGQEPDGEPEYHVVDEEETYKDIAQAQLEADQAQIPAIKRAAMERVWDEIQSALLNIYNKKGRPVLVVSDMGGYRKGDGSICFHLDIGKGRIITDKYASIKELFESGLLGEDKIKEGTGDG